VGIGQSEWIINENYSDDFFLKLITLLAFELDQFLLDGLIEDVGYYFMEYAWYTKPITVHINEYNNPLTCLFFHLIFLFANKAKGIWRPSSMSGRQSS
jgi:hypothetical protein